MIRFAAVLRLLGLLLMVFSLSMLPPVGVEMYYRDGSIQPFLAGFICCLAVGFCIWFPMRKQRRELKSGDGFLVVVLFWVVLATFAAVPFLVTHRPELSVTDAMFEAMSGLTTTGATVLSGLSQFSHSMLYYRQQLQFLGGMGIIVLAIAIMPMLGVGGMQLYQAEMPGPLKESKLTPRLAGTAKALWYIYVGLFIVCAGCYWTFGMSLFDAVCESFSTVATGGFTIHDASFGFYHSTAIDVVAMVFMVLGATNFALHFMAIAHRSLRHYVKDLEFMTMLLLHLFVLLIVASVLLADRIFSHTGHALLQATFATISIGTTTGFVDAKFALWPGFVPILLMLLAVLGGCAASTSGGIKILRFLLLYKQTGREILRLIHPRAVLSIKFGTRILPDNVIQAMWGFIAVFFMLYGLMVILLMATGLDFTTAFGAATSTLTNAGASIGGVAATYAGLTPVAKWLVIIGMLIGRLEIFSILVLLSPAYWRH